MRSNMVALLTVAAFIVFAAVQVVQITGAEQNHSDNLFDFKQQQAMGERPSKYCKVCEKPCGVIPPGEKTQNEKIVGGQDAQENEFGWAVLLANNGKLFCGGTLITKKHVLTAAHCLKRLKFDDDLTVIIGEHDLRVDTYRQSVHHVAKFNFHQEFDFKTYNNDIGILELREVVSIITRPWVRFACLPKTDEESYTGTIGTTIGWGVLKENKELLSNILQKLKVPILSDRECKHNLGYRPNEITRNMMCAGFKEGHRDACQGDSGGPLLRNVDLNVLEVIGITSWGFGCARPNFPGIYTKVANYLNWIMDNIGGECICTA